MSEAVKSGLQSTEGGDGVLFAKPTGNTARVELFTTSATFSLPIKKEQQSLKFLLESKKVILPLLPHRFHLLTHTKVTYEEFDVCSNKAKGDEMRERSGQRKLPQLFINGEFIGGYEEAMQLEEIGQLSEKLGSS